MRKRFLTFLASAIFLICAYPHLAAQEQSTRFIKIGEYSEYSDHRISCLFQDSRGLIWMGTIGGMDCWDGNRIRSYTMPPFDSTGFPATAVYSFAEDDHNNLWLGSRIRGLIKYDIENEKFIHINNPQKHPELGNINCLKYDPSGFLWLGTSSNPYRYYPEEDRFEIVQVQDSLIYKNNGSLGVFDIEFDTLGVMWLASGWGLYYYDKENDIIKPQFIPIPINPDGRIWYTWGLSIDRNGIIWMLQGNAELIRFNPYTKTIDSIWPRKYEDVGFLPRNGAIHSDSEGKIWLYHDRNLAQYDPSTGKVTIERDITVTDIIEDKEGNILVAAFDGIRLLDKNGSQISRFTTEYLNFSNQTFITEILIDEHIYWIGTWGNGVLKLDVETGKKVSYRQSDKAGSLSNDNITRILKDRHDQIWIMTVSGLHLYESEKDNFKRIPVDFRSMITEGREGNLWIAGNDKLIRFNPITFDTKETILNESLRRTGVLADVYGFVQDTNGFLWVGDEWLGGLIRIDPRNGDCVHFRHDVNNPFGLPSDMVITIFYDSKNRMWVGTKAGLSQVNTFPPSDSIYCINYFIKDGLIGNNIFGLTEDISGNIWVATASGISILKTDGTIQNLDVDDGLTDPPLTWTISSDAEGNIYAGTGDIVKIPANFLRAPNKVPPILFTDIQISGESILPGDKSPLKKSILYADQVELKYHENFIRIEFAALNYTHPEKNRYRYILEGVDRDTVNAQLKSYAEYTELRPGKYTFWATGSNDAGLWNTEGKQLIVIIHPPPWASWWAYTIYGLIIIYIIFLYRQFLIRRASEKLSLKFQEEEVNRMKELDNMKSTFFANISHEFRTPLTLILGPLESLSKGNFKGNLQREAKVMYNNSKRLIRSINQILNLSKIDADKLELKASKQNFGDFLKQIVANYDTATAEKDIALYCEIEENLEIYFDPDLMQDVINNLISNAVKFTPNNGTIKVSLSFQEYNPQKTFIPGNEVLEFKLTDTGIGIPEDQIPHIFDRFYQVDSGQTREHEGTGIGLSLVNEIVKMHHGSINVNSEQGEGTEFTVLLPIGSKHLKPEQFNTEKAEPVVEETILSEFESTATILAEQDEEQIESKSLPYVLIVDDNSDMRRYIRNHLIGTFRVEEAENGLSGFERAKTTIPELIVSDVMMPKMDGNQLCNRIKNEEKTRHIPVILLTAKAGKESKIEGLETGADDYISKPFDADELRIRIKNLIEQRKQLREQFSKKWILEPEEVKIESADDQFLEKVMKLIEENMSNPELTVISFGRALGMSKPQLYRKLTALTDMSPNVFIRTMRLKRAAQLFKAKEGSISEIAYRVGFSSPSYFTQCFKETFGSVPTEYS